MERRLVKGGSKGRSEKEHYDVVRVLRQLGVLVWAFLVACWCLIGWGIYFLAGM